jgi:HEAT repeat protein
MNARSPLCLVPRRATLVAGVLGALALASPARAADEIALRQVERDGIVAIEAPSTCAGHDPGALVDGRLWSAWAAGPGDAGRVDFDLGSTRYLVRLDVVLGDARNPATFRDSVRPGGLVVVADEERRAVALEDRSGYQTVHFDPPIEARRLTLVLEARGLRARGCGSALSEVRFWEPSDILSLRPSLRADIDARLATLLAPDSAAPERQAAAEALERIGSPAATSVLLALRSAPAARVPDLVWILSALGDGRGAGYLHERLARATAEERLPLLRGVVRLPDAQHVPLLTRAAQDGPAEERLVATQALAAIPGAAAERVLLGLVRDRDPAVAAAAAGGFCGRDSAPLVRLAPELAHAPAAVQRAAFACLPDEVAPGDQASLRALRARVGDPGAQAALLARTCRPGDTEGLQAAEAFARHRDPTARAAAVRCLDRGGAPDEALLAAALDPAAAVRDEALAALARRGGPALAGLAVRVLDVPSLDIAPYAAVLAGQPRAERVRAALLWSRFGPPSWTPGAARLLGPGDDDPLRALVDGVSVDGPDGRALVRLLHADRAAWAAPAARLFAAGEWRTRPLLVAVLGAVGRPADAALLDAVLAAGDPRLLDDAARALAALGGPDAVPLLARLSAPGLAEHVRRLAVEGLGAAGLPQAAPPLDALLADPTTPAEVRAAAVDAVARLRGPGALPLLEAEFLGEEYTVRRAALVACQRLEDRRALDLLSRAATDGDPAIRRLGLSLLAKR